MEEGATRHTPKKQGENTGSLISQQVAAIDHRLTRQFTSHTDQVNFQMSE